MSITAVIVCVFAYFFGAIPFALIIGKLHGVDIRKVGSGNVGATNVTRAVGPVQGKICFVNGPYLIAVISCIVHVISGE